MKSVVILYHANCPDGFSAAWAAWKKFKKKASYIPVEYQTPRPKGLEGKEIYLLDFSYNPAKMRELVKKNRRVVLIDHHLSAKASVRFIKEKSFDTSHSGAVLAWHYFHPKNKVPRLLEHIEDYDLWHFKKTFTREVAAALELENRNFKNWDSLMKRVEAVPRRKKVVETGKIILAAENKLIKKLVDKATPVIFKGQKVKAVNSPILMSEIGHELVTRGSPFAIIWHQDKNKIKVSLRSDGKVDVSKIAESFGGGGHKAAAGFSVKSGQKLPWKISK